jgi:hypothetical protein
VQTARSLARASFALLAVLVTIGLAFGVPAASARPLRRIAGHVQGLATDYHRWVVWQLLGAKRAELLDLRSGHLRSVALDPQCLHGVANGRESSSGMFLFVDCGAYLNARSGQTGALPSTGYAYEWRRIGTRYVEGAANNCSPRCVALLDLATGSVSLRHQRRVFDLDRPGAPPTRICAALRKGALWSLEVNEGLAGLYEPGALVKYRGDSNAVEVRRCRGRSMVIRNAPVPWSLDLGDGLVSWDTAEPTFPAVEPNLGNRLELATQSGRRLGSWRLPALHIREAPTTRLIPGREVAGDSFHLGKSVFWAGITGWEDGIGGGAVEYELFEAHL